MAETSEYIRQVQEKLQQLLKRYAILQKENETLKEQLAELQASATNSKSVIEQLQQQVDVLRLNNLGMNEQEKKVFEKKIKDYVKEIDRCIALLKE